MTQTITTRYHGPTNTKPARYSATTSSGVRKWFPSHLQLGDDANQHGAAYALAAFLNWPGHWQGGALNDKGAMVWVNTSDSFAHNYRFEVQK